MHIRSKFDGGKQINRSQAGGWQGRCAGAGLRQNLAGDWGPQTWKVITNKEPNKVFKDVSTHRAEQIVKDRKRKAGDAAKESRWKSKRLKTNDGVCDLSLTEAAQSKQFFLSTDGDSGQLHLKMSHSYYYQIQTAMFCTQRKWCD